MYATVCHHRLDPPSNAISNTYDDAASHIYTARHQVVLMGHILEDNQKIDGADATRAILAIDRAVRASYCTRGGSTFLVSRLH